MASPRAPLPPTASNRPNEVTLAASRVMADYMNVVDVEMLREVYRLSGFTLSVVAVAHPEGTRIDDLLLALGTNRVLSVKLYSSILVKSA